MYVVSSNNGLADTIMDNNFGTRHSAIIIYCRVLAQSHSQKRPNHMHGHASGPYSEGYSSSCAAKPIATNTSNLATTSPVYILAGLVLCMYQLIEHSSHSNSRIAPVHFFAHRKNKSATNLYGYNFFPWLEMMIEAI